MSPASPPPEPAATPTAPPEELSFESWRQRCLDDALDLVDRVLFGGSGQTQPGLRPAWQAQLREALLHPREAALDSATAGVVVDTWSGVKLLSDDEVSQSVQSRATVQALEEAADWPLRELAAQSMRWHQEAEWLGYPGSVLLEPATLTETLDRALNACVPVAGRRLELLRELHAPLVREAVALYGRQRDWLDHRVALDAERASRHHLAAPTGPAEAGGLPLAIDATQLPGVFERLRSRAGLGAGMRAVLAEIEPLVQHAVAADALLLLSTDNPLWQFIDRLVALSQLDTAGRVPGKVALPERLRPLIDALHRAPQPLLLRHFEQALFHLERLASAALPDPVAAGSEQALAQAERRGELQPLVHAQVLDQLARSEVLPVVRQFLLGDWVRVVTQSSARDGVDAAGPRRWTALVETLADAARLDRPRPPSPAALDCLLLEIRDGLRELGEAPARIDRQLDELESGLRSWPRLRPEATADTPDNPPVAAGSPDVLASDWAHHGDLATVPLAMDGDTDGAAARDRAQWLATLAPGDLCRATLQGRWGTVRLDWISDNGQFFAFSRRQGAPFCASRRVLERMRGEGLITTIPRGAWLRDAVDSLPELHR